MLHHRSIRLLLFFLSVAIVTFALEYLFIILGEWILDYSVILLLGANASTAMVVENSGYGIFFIMLAISYAFSVVMCFGIAYRAAKHRIHAAFSVIIILILTTFLLLSSIGVFIAYAITAVWQPDLTFLELLGTCLEGAVWALEKGGIAILLAFPLNIIAYAVGAGLTWLLYRIWLRWERKYMPPAPEQDNSEHLIEL